MTHIAVIGCGVIGAAIAYELSLLSGITVTVFDAHPPAQASTGAALGVLMGVISQKTKGNAWNLRERSLTRYATLIPELESLLNRLLPVNRQGILRLNYEAETLPQWQALIETRQAQGWVLEQWDAETVRHRCPQVQTPRLVGGIYSPSDRQLDPTALTLALVDAARHNGVTFEFEVEVAPLALAEGHCTQLHTAQGTIAVDRVIVTAGLGSTLLSQAAPRPLDIRPVLGQAMRVRSLQPLGNPDFQPVITGEDIHIVPVSSSEYWIGATVEFPDDSGEVEANTDLLQTVWQGAIAMCPDLADAEILHTWSGLRPRPYNRPAPIIEPLTASSNVMLATGHYRNGVLLAPATALLVRDWICSDEVFR